MGKSHKRPRVGKVSSRNGRAARTPPIALAPALDVAAAIAAIKAMPRQRATSLHGSSRTRASNGAVKPAHPLTIFCVLARAARRRGQCLRRSRRWPSMPQPAALDGEPSAASLESSEAITHRKTARGDGRGLSARQRRPSFASPPSSRR